MGLEDLIEQEVASKRKPCKFGAHIAGEDDATVGRLLRLNDSAISRVMHANGTPVSNHVIGRHKRQECGCFDG